MDEERDERGRDVLGFIEECCPHCNAPLYLSDEPNAFPICLNACMLPVHLYRRMQNMLYEASKKAD